MTTSVKKASPLVDASTWKDNASTTYGNQNGVTFCGPRTYTMTAPASVPSWFTLTGSDTAKSRNINAPNLVNADITTGTNYTIRVCLQKYSTLCIDKTF